jgi:hypothetical protein
MDGSFDNPLLSHEAENGFAVVHHEYAVNVIKADLERKND